MSKGTRTDDVYESIAGYPTPPSCRIPDSRDLSGLACCGALSQSKLARWIAQATLSVSGFHQFARELPERLEESLRKHNLRLTDLAAHGLSATALLEDDSKLTCPYQRAASLIIAARQLRDEIMSGELPPDRVGDAVAEMGQYPNLFGTHIVLDEEAARICKTTNVSEVVVIVSHQFYLLDLGERLTPDDLPSLAGALRKIAEAARRQSARRSEPSPAIATCAETAVQLGAFEQFRKEKTNRDTLEKLQHSLFTVCLDLDCQPDDRAHTAWAAHSGNLANRWFHSSLQLVVFGNAKACAIDNFNAYLDGNVIVRATAEIQRRAARLSVLAAGQTERTLAFQELPWRVSEAVLEPIRAVLQSRTDHQEATFELMGIGAEYFRSRQVDPIGAFIVALQMTANRLTDVTPQIHQFISQSNYCCMGLRTVVVTTPEVIQLAERMQAGSTSPDEVQALLRRAVESQKNACRAARPYLRLEDVIQLYLRTSKGLRRFRAVASVVVGLTLLHCLGLSDLRPDIVVSHPAIHPEVPVVGRPGARLPYVKYFGLNYQIHADRTTITLMPSLDWHVPNREFAAFLKYNLLRLTEGIPALPLLSA